MRKIRKNHLLAQEETSLAQPCVSSGVIQMTSPRGPNLAPDGRNLAPDIRAAISQLCLLYVKTS
ncbi:hypothetical protein Hanom_Chr13g01219531 [Helianthus anomalus]